MSASVTVAFDTHKFIKQMVATGFTEEQAETQVRLLSEILDTQLATKGDIIRLEKDILRLEKGIETAKVETIKWVIVTGIAILGGVAALIRFAPPVPVYYQPPSQEMRQSAPSSTLPAPSAPASAPTH